MGILKRRILFLSIIIVGLFLDLFTKWYVGSIFHADGKTNCPYPDCTQGVISYDQPCLSVIEPNRQVELCKPIIKDVFDIHLLNNTGAAWSFLSGKNNWFIVLNIAFLICAFYFMMRKKNDMTIISYIAFAIIISGAMGNFHDRLVHGSVRDFLSFFIPLPNGKVYAYPVFNVADMCIFIGAALYFIDQIILERFRQKKQTNQDSMSIVNENAK